MIRELNSNISSKNARIKHTFRSIKKVRVYFAIQVYKLDMSDMVLELSELKSFKSKWKTLTHTDAERVKLLTIRPAQYRYQLVRIQTSGYVGGIILGGSRTVMEDLTF